VIDTSKYKNTVSYRDDRDAWMSEERRLRTLFESDLAAEYGMTDHPKRDMLWLKAWEEGHPNGLSDVAVWYDALWELVQ
jgi:hypothetical protein